MMPEKFLETSEFKTYLKLLRQNAWLILLLSVIGYVSGRLVTYRQLDIHSATAEILLRQEQGADARVRLLGELNGRRATEDVQNQLRIIQSYDLVGKAVDRLNIPVDYFFVGRLRTTQVPGFNNLSIQTLPGLFHPEMTGRDIDIQILDEHHFTLSYTRPDGSDVNERREFDVPIEGPDLAMTVGYTAGLNQLEAAKKQHFRIQVYDRERRIAQFRSGLSVNNVERTSILSLSASSTLPGRAKQFLDTLGSVFIQHTQASELESRLQSESFIEERISDLAIILDSLEREGEVFRSTRNVLDVEREQTVEFAALSGLENELRTLDATLGQVRGMQDFFASSASGEGIPPGQSLHSADPIIGQLVTRLSTLRNDRAAALLEVTEASYPVRRIDSAIRVTRFSLVRYLEESHRSLQTERKVLAQEIYRIEQRLGDFPSTRKDLLAIERKLKVNEDLYTFLLEAKANSFIERAGVAPTASLVEQARSGGIIGPNKRRTVAMSTGVGFLMAIGIAALRFLFFKRIESLDELKEVTSLSVLGAIPRHERIAEHPISILSDPRSQLTESFRSIRTGLHYILPSKNNTSILISSLHPGEGKSFVSSNLAAVLAKTGKNVALVDLDLHKPRVHTYFGLPNRKGVSSVLMGDATVETVYQQGPLPTLHVYTSGPVPPSASELVFSAQLSILLQALKDQYDYVILDTPPILLITDALVLLQYVDCGVFVMNAEKTTLHSVKKLEDQLVSKGFNNAAVVLNNVRLTRWQKIVYRYTSTYGYGYGYGQGARSAYGDAPENQERPPSTS